MKKYLAGAWVVLFCIMAVESFGADWTNEWKAVEEAAAKGLPRTAITNLEPILAGALAERNYPEAVKALGRRIMLETGIEGSKPEEAILRLQKELPSAPDAMKPVLETLLAHWYWGYYQQNQWRFQARTATTEAPGGDFTTWDLARLFDEISSHFQKALSEAALLKTIKIGAWDGLLTKGTMPDEYRPTLYDFISYEALKFYTQGSVPLSIPEGAFEFSGDSPALQSSDRFLEWTPAIDTNLPPAPDLNALRLFQDLLRFHRADPAPRLAFAHADLERLTWAWNTALGEEKNGRYKASLGEFIREWGNQEISALASERLARLEQSENNLVAARETAARAAKAFPDSPGGKLCRNIIADIESKSVQITTEYVWNAPWPEITVNHKNVDKVFFRAFRANWEDFLDRNQRRPENLPESEKRRWIARPAALEWSANLPSTADYKPMETGLPAPPTLPAGFYFIAASHDAGFGEADNQVSLTTVWVSDLALVTRPRAGRIEGFVLDAQSGEPLPGAEVSAWHLDQDGRRVAEPAARTDAQGFFSLQNQAQRGHLLRARHQGREVATRDDIRAYERQPDERPRGTTTFFTDRAIYRPGQTLQYKGVCLWVDKAQDKYEVLKGERVTVVFSDSNGKEISRQDRQANDYGSFSGSFTAPRDSLMGAMSLRVKGRAPGSANFRVEEYKRPKFEVTLAPPKSGGALNQTVTIPGRASSYTGAAVDGAKVSYRVTRQARMPWWWGPWRMAFLPPIYSQAREIAHGVARTAADGSFTIQFEAAPDLSIPATNNPSFTFVIHADVTDSAGETRSDERSVRLGHSALEARLSAEDWQTANRPVVLKVRTASLDDEPLSADGIVRVYGLKQPDTVERPPLRGGTPRYPRPMARGAKADESGDLSKPENWPLGAMIAEKPFSTPTNGQQKLEFALPAGPFRAVIQTRDRSGREVKGELQILVLDEASRKLPIQVPQLVAAPKWELQPGEEFAALWGTGYESGRAFIEIEHRGKFLQRFWTSPGRTQQQVKQAVTEAMRGGLILHVTQVRENRALLESRTVAVPWKNKDLTLKWERFVSKLEPGQRETWSLSITPALTNADAAPVAAELAATLYDASLDAFARHQWPSGFNIFRREYPAWNSGFANAPANFQTAYGRWTTARQGVEISYRDFPPGLIQTSFPQRRYWTRLGRGMDENRFYAMAPSSAAAPMMMPKLSVGGAVTDSAVMGVQLAGAPSAAPQEEEEASPARIPVSPRRNLNETAFFFPHLTSDSNGVARLSFVMPEALTRWRFLGFAHDREVRSGLLEGETVTARDLMVQPNPPRFLREGDTVEFTVKVLNQSDAPQSGRVSLNFNLAESGQSADALLGNTAPEQSFEIPAGESRSHSWRVTVPDGCGFLTYTAKAASDKMADGEEGAIPVLSRRILVTESIALPIRGPGTKTFKFDKLIESAGSDSLRHQSLTAQMVSNPAWYAVLALPYLMEFPHECSEQVFNRLYANALARNIAGSNPRIRRIFDLWKNTPALDSPLEKNQDLKSVMLEETPWVRQAKKESEARRNVGVLFDENRLDSETAAAFEKLSKMQLGDGAWPWFPGGRANDFITLYITTGFGRLRHLGVEVPMGAALQSLGRLDAWIARRHEDILKNPEPGKHVPSQTEALYLYGRSLFLKDRPIAPEHRTAVDFFLARSREHWLATGNRQTQAHIALALKRFAASDRKTDATPAAIMDSLRERAVSSDEMGMFWREGEQSWWWYRAPIETQALMIEAFDEVAGDARAVEDCRVWLLKQKQTRDWKTTKATADAVYALLLRGRDLLSSDALVQLRLDGLDLTPSPEKPAPGGKRVSVEPGTGFYEVRFSGSEIRPEMGNIAVTKTDPGVAWGSVHWQYLEDMAKITPHTNNPLTLRKTLYLKRNTSAGPKIEPAGGALAPGDELVTRVELRTDRDMEYIHLKDQRGSGTEPVNVLSHYKYQDGLAYYESTRDTATHFFIDYLPRGVYVFEYSSRVQLRGNYQTGMALIECMYAPEFNSHSGSVALSVE